MRTFIACIRVPWEITQKIRSTLPNVSVETSYHFDDYDTKELERALSFAFKQSDCTIVDPSALPVEMLEKLIETHRGLRQSGRAPILMFLDTFTDEQADNTDCLSENATDFNFFPDNQWKRMENMLKAAKTPCYNCIEQMEDRSIEGPWRVLDLVTTGADPIEADIIAINTATLENGQIKEPQTIYIKPRRPVPQSVTDRTGITDEMAQNGLTYEQVAQHIFDLNPLFPNLITYFIAKDKKVKETGEGFKEPAPFLISSAERDVPFLKSLFYLGGKKFDLPYISVENLAAIPLGYTLFEEYPETKQSAIMDAGVYEYDIPGDEMPESLSALCGLAQTSFDLVRKGYGVKKVGDLKKIY